MDNIITTVTFQSTRGILKEIEEAVNDFKNDSKKVHEVELRLRGCNHAIKIHMLDYLKVRMANDMDRGKYVPPQLS